VKDVTEFLAEISGNLDQVRELPLENVPAVMALFSAAQMTLAVRMLKTPNVPSEAAVVSKTDCAISVEEAAARLSFTKQYLYELIRRGEIPAIRHGKYVRILESDLAAWMKKHTENPLEGNRQTAYCSPARHAQRSCGGRHDSEQPGTEDQPDPEG